MLRERWSERPGALNRRLSLSSHCIFLSSLFKVLCVPYVMDQHGVDRITLVYYKKYSNKAI
jgi:hypothetical protein